jgi:hypothetical protein
MNDEENLDSGVFDPPVIYVVPDDGIDDETDFEVETVEYLLAQVDDDYEEVVLHDPYAHLDDEIIPLEDRLLDEHDLEVA